MELEEILPKLNNVINNAGQYTALCPSHNDTVNSLSISENSDGDILLHCHAGCETEDVLAAIGLEIKDLFYGTKKQPPVTPRAIAEYIYVDMNGNPLHKVVRYEPKSFSQARADPNSPSGWSNNLNGIQTILYNLPAVGQAVKSGKPVLIVEGEKDVEALRMLGLTATTNPGGAGKWKERYSDCFANAYVYIIPDNDRVGKAHAQKIAASLKGKAAQIKVLDLSDIVPSMQGKGDISDVLHVLGHQATVQGLLEIMNRTEVYTGNIPVEQSKFFEKHRLRHDLLAKHLLSTFPVAKIKNRLSMYVDKLYTADRSAFERAMISMAPTLTISQRNEVYSYLCHICDKELDESPANFIGLKNYIMDIDTGNMFPYSPYYVILNRILYDYNPNAYDKTLDDALNAYACGDPAIRALIEEMYGYCLYRRNELGIAFFLKGIGRNGKSTLLTLLALLLGLENYSSLELKELNKQFCNIEVVDKLANIGDDISDEYISDSSIFKKLVTGESITFRGLYEKPFKYKSYAKLIFSCNEMPTVRDKSDGFERRLMIVPLNGKFDKATPGFDPYFIDKISTQGAMEYLLKIAIDGLKRVLANKGFTICSSVAQATQAYVSYNNPLTEFVKEVGDLSRLTASEAYFAYQSWANINGFQPLNNIVFGRELKKQTGYVSVPNGKDTDGKTVRRYVKENMVIVPDNTDATDYTDNKANP